MEEVRVLYCPKFEALRPSRLLFVVTGECNKRTGVQTMANLLYSRSCHFGDSIGLRDASSSRHDDRGEVKLPKDTFSFSHSWMSIQVPFCTRTWHSGYSGDASHITRCGAISPSSSCLTRTGILFNSRDSRVGLIRMSIILSTDC